MFRKIVITCIALLSAGTALASMPAWQYLSPLYYSDKDVLATGYDPIQNKWYAYASGLGTGSLYATFRTDNTLNDWEHKNGGNACVICGYNNASVVYSAEGSTVWWSETHGQYWEDRSEGISPNFSARSFGIDPANTEFVLLGGYHSTTESNVYLTTNGGVNWSARTLPSYDMDVISIKVVPTTPYKKIYLAGGSVTSIEPPFPSGMGFYRSLDGGGTWVRSFDNYDLRSVALDPNDPTGMKLWIADNGAWGDDPGWVRWSKDGGETWVQQVQLPPVNAVTSLVAVSSTVLLASTDIGIFRSEDSGLNWAPSNTGLCGKMIYTLSLHSGNPSLVYAAEIRTMYWSQDGGLTWQQKVNGLCKAQGIYGLSTALPSAMYCFTDCAETVQKSTDQGHNWVVFHSGKYFNHVATDPKNPERAFTTSSLPINRYFCSRTIDGGGSWVDVYTIETQYPDDNQDVAIDTVSPNVIYQVIASGIPPPPPPFGSAAILRSRYGGDPGTWESLPSGAPSSVVSIAIDSRRWVYAGGVDNSGNTNIRRSTDEGDHWSDPGQGLPLYYAPFDIHANPLDANKVYTRTGEGVYKSSDGCQNWEVCGLPGQEVSALTLDPSEPEILYAATRTTPGQTFVTVDGGAEWVDVGSLLPNAANDLAIDGTMPAAVFAGISSTPQGNQGIYSLTPTYQFKSLTSASSEASDYNSQRKLVRQEGTVNLHAVYHSGSTSNHNVYYVSSTDGGNSWSPKVLLGQGIHPTLDLDFAGNPQVLWLSDDMKFLYYAFSNGGVWSGPQAIFSAPDPDHDLLGPPAFRAVPGMIGSRGHVVFSWESDLHSPYHAILYGWLPLNMTGQTLQGVTGVDAGDVNHECLRPSLTSYLGDYMGFYGYSLHAAWTKGDQVYYASKKLQEGENWTAPGQISENAGSHDPNIEAYGDRVHVAWVEPVGSKWTQVTHRSRFLPDGLWDVGQEAVTVARGCASPQMAAGSYCVWGQGDGEIYYAYRTWEGWQTPTNWSNTPQRSASPQVTFAPWMMGTTLFCFWTEDDGPPYQEYFATTMGPLGGFFSLDAGQEQASSYTVHRGGYQQYARHPEKTVDTDGSYLSYRFRHLDPRKLYLVRASYYQETGSPSGLEVKVDGSVFANVAVPSRSVIRGEAWLPSELYADSVVELVIRKKSGTLGTLGYLELCQAEPKGKGGPQSSELADLYLPKEFSLGAGYPNPMTSEARIAYALPKASSVDLTVYNVSGQVVNRLVSEASKAPGRYSIRWDGRDDRGYRVPAGVYFYRLQAGSFSETKKLVVVR
jgi:photosystem II stability/assembly factor-like uncharacterized protein